MKNLFFLLFFLSPSILQSQVCSTMWPYIYNNFQKGDVIFNDGKIISEFVNIHVLESKLHFLKNELIFEASDHLIKSVVINKDTFVNVENTFVKVLKCNGSTFLGLIRKGDFNALLNPDGAYGSSSNSSSVNKLSSLNIGGVNNMNHMFLKSNIDQGKPLSIISNYCFVIDNKMYSASKKEIENLFDTENDIEFKNFLKKNDISWKNEKSLYLVLDFLLKHNNVK